MKNFPYQITIAWSADDDGYVARVPALRYCLVFGDTPEDAVKEVKIAAEVMLKVMEREGKPLPAVDATLARVQALQPLLNVSAIATAAKISVQTMSSKISRGTAFTSAESGRIGKVLAAHGIAPGSVAALASSALRVRRKTVVRKKTSLAASVLSVGKKGKAVIKKH